MHSVRTLIRYDGEVLGISTPHRVEYTAALEHRAALEPLRTRRLKRFVVPGSLTRRRRPACR